MSNSELIAWWQNYSGKRGLADLLVIAILETIGFQSMPGIMKLLREHSSCSRWNLKYFLSFKKECAVFCTRWELGAIFTILFLHYLPTSSSVRPGKTGLDFLSKNTRVEKSARDSCNKKLSILSWKRKTNKYTTLLFFFLFRFANSLKSAAV